MKIDAFRKAQVLVEELEKVHKVTSALESGQSTISLQIGKMSVNTKKRIHQLFIQIEKELEKDLDKIN